LTLSNPLKNYRILLIDADVELARVLKLMLAEMGFSNVYVTRSGRDAINMLREADYDFIITEWNTLQLDGLALLQYIRRDKRSAHPTLPVIMLTGRAEIADVVQARDYGVNEYVVKPFTAATIMNRLERLIEHPRTFVVSDGFVGPDRRSKSKPPEGVPERRAARTARMQPDNVQKAAREDGDLPKLWLPDFSLKLKLGRGIKLQDFITPDVLNQAQNAINAIADASLQWIKDDLTQLTGLCKIMTDGKSTETIPQEIGELALSINSRAGTFGFTRGAEIAYALYLFTRNKLDTQNKGHHIVVQKHIEVLHIILGNQMSGDAGAIGAQITAELRALSNKYS
jgi:two-component system, chemotaxis family, chemotaxis protein CheY